MRSLPWSLVLMRLLLAPAIVLLARSRASGFMLAAAVIVALVSDIYDGVIARRLGTDTAALRIADSLTDTVFYLGVLLALSIRVPQALQRFWPLLVVLLALEIIRYCYDLAKFGRMASYHSYLAKAWGLVMAVSVMIVFITGRFEILLVVSMLMGVLNNIEGLTFSLLLPVWRRDVKTITDAIAIRRLARGGTTPLSL